MTNSKEQETSLADRNAAFRQFLDTLNAAQRQAVEQTEGPVLVLAGPGTGKTQVLTARIGNILLNTDARPQNVLCLTFTDAGVHAMRQRLLTLIGPDAHRVPILTYHSFCNRIIQENLEYFGRADLEPLTELERIEIVRNLLEQLPPNHPLRDGNKQVYQFERQVRTLFEQMKTEGWTPGHVHRQIDQWLTQLPENEDFIYRRDSKFGKKGTLKHEKIADETERMNRLRATADLYPRYVTALQRAARYEYADMILWVLRAFERHPDLLRNYQERYLYVLVDEYQDTNGAQNSLLARLLDYWDQPNIFIVGDDDQSIYEFQGARLQNLLDFYQRHREHLLTVVLTQNYRSTQPILDTARRVIEHNQLRAASAFETPVSKVLQANVPPNSVREAYATPQASAYPNRLSEDVGTVERIAQLLADGVRPDHIAVIFARHRQATRVVALLQKRGIPFQTKRPANLLELPLIHQLRDLLRYLADEMRVPFSGEHRLFRLLHAPFWGIEPLDLARLATELRQPGNTRHWREAVSERGWDAAAWLCSLPEADTAGRPLPELLERIYTRTGLAAWALQQPDKAWHLQVLSTFLAFVQQETGRHPHTDLYRLLDLLDSLEDNRIPLPIQQQLNAAPEPPPAPPLGGSTAFSPGAGAPEEKTTAFSLAPSVAKEKAPLPPTGGGGGGSGVQLITAHSAKGLEFEHVFLLDCTTEGWEPGARDGSRGFKLPPTLTLSGEEDALEARRRLFFVALTRAKRHLYLSYAETDDVGKNLTASRFLSESGVETVPAAVSTEQLFFAQTVLLTEPPRPVVTLPDEQVLADFLDGFTLNVTSFNRYLRCPLAFFYEDVLRVPGTPSEAAAFGQAMHTALQQFFLKMQRSTQHEWPDEDSLLRLFGQEMERLRGFFSQNAWTQRMALGRSLLIRYRLEQVPYWRKRARAEFRLDRVNLDDAVLTGVVDKIEYLDDGSLRIVDYKTGTPNPKKTAAPTPDEPQGGDYWRQLAFYRVLLEQSKLFAEDARRGVISWLELDKKGNFTNHETVFETQDLAAVRDLIRSVWRSIQNREFSTGCGQPDCAWCRMHRDRTLPEVVLKPEEGLDDAPNF